MTSVWSSWAHSQFSHVENIKSRCASQINSCEHLRNNAISKQFCIYYFRVEINRKYFLTFFLKSFCLYVYLFQLCVYMCWEVVVVYAVFSETRRWLWHRHPGAGIPGGVSVGNQTWAFNKSSLCSSLLSHFSRVLPS